MSARLKDTPHPRSGWSPRHFRGVAVILLALTGWAAASMAGAESPKPEPPAPMVPLELRATPEAEVQRELQETCATLYETNYYWGRQAVPRLEARLAELEAAPDSHQALRLRGRLAMELLRLGRADRALGRLREVADLLLTTRDLSPPQSASLEGDLLIGRILAWLQRAEQVNCVESHGHGTCLYPVPPEGVHHQPEALRTVARLAEEYLASHPDDLQAHWLLKVSRQLTGTASDTESGTGSASPATASDALGRWPEVTEAMGLGDGSGNRPDLAGGAILDDFDNDGHLDLVFSTSDPCASMKAYRNDGAGGFQDVTEAWGLGNQLGGLNVVQADYDDDGDLDLLVLRGAWLGREGEVRNSLLENDLRASGRFRDVTRAAGLAEPAYPTQTGTWADYDGDGDLDLYVANEVRAIVSWPSQLFRDPAGYNPALLFRDPEPFNPMLFLSPDQANPGQLFRNNGDRTFTDVAAEAGVTNLRFAKGAAWGDYDNDGDPDLFVTNLGLNRLYRNDGDGTFTDVAPQVGAANPMTLSFATWFFDVDNDGDLDLFAGDHTSRVPDVVAYYLGRGQPAVAPQTLLINDGGRFHPASAEWGLDRSLLVMGANHGDIDNDGYPDLYLGTGNPDLDSLMPNVMLRNRRGEGFEDVTAATGTGHLQKGHGVAFGDVDNDGDQDLLHQLGGAYPTDAFANALFLNPGTPGSHWLTLKLEGSQANHFGVGARVEVVVREGDERRSIHHLVGSGGSFGGSSLQAEIGLGNATLVEWAIVRWPGSGTVQRLENLEVDRIYKVVEPPAEGPEPRLPALEVRADVSP